MIAAEGKVILIPIFLVLIFGFGVQQIVPMTWLYKINWLVLALFIFSLYFFRIPVRQFPDDEKLFISPADGKIVKITAIDDPDLGAVTQISIFLSVFNVHKQWIPLSGTVLDKNVNKGKFLAAFNHKASMDNEQTSTVLKDLEGNKFKIKQIAGLIARRIINNLSAGETVVRGNQLGFIRFGSRVDILVGDNFKINIEMGDKVKGGETIIGYFK
jgi:phosphatidylserine decarboxylase